MKWNGESVSITQLSGCVGSLRFAGDLPGIEQNPSTLSKLNRIRSGIQVVEGDVTKRTPGKSKCVLF